MFGTLHHTRHKLSALAHSLAVFGVAVSSRERLPPAHLSKVFQAITTLSDSTECHLPIQAKVFQGDTKLSVTTAAVQHTSASLTINENASPDVPKDLNVSAMHRWPGHTLGQTYSCVGSLKIYQSVASEVMQSHGD